MLSRLSFCSALSKFILTTLRYLDQQPPERTPGLSPLNAEVLSLEQQMNPNQNRAQPEGPPDAQLTYLFKFHGPRSPVRHRIGQVMKYASHNDFMSVAESGLFLFLSDCTATTLVLSSSSSCNLGL